MRAELGEQHLLARDQGDRAVGRRDVAVVRHHLADQRHRRRFDRPAFSTIPSSENASRLARKSSFVMFPAAAYTPPPSTIAAPPKNTPAGFTM
jgi:hypothetical protein